MINKLRNWIYRAAQSRGYATIKDLIAYSGAILPSFNLSALTTLDPTGFSAGLVTLGAIMGIGPLWIGNATEKLKKQVNLLEARVIILENQIKQLKHFALIAFLAYINIKWNVIGLTIDFVVKTLKWTSLVIAPWLIAFFILGIFVLNSGRGHISKSISNPIDQLVEEDKKPSYRGPINRIRRRRTTNRKSNYFRSKW